MPNAAVRRKGSRPAPAAVTIKPRRAATGRSMATRGVSPGRTGITLREIFMPPLAEAVRNSSWHPWKSSSSCAPKRCCRCLRDTSPPIHPPAPKRQQAVTPNRPTLRQDSLFPPENLPSSRSNRVRLSSAGRQGYLRAVKAGHRRGPTIRDICVYVGWMKRSASTNCRWNRFACSTLRRICVAMC